ncbi:unnamed protein product [Paramecium octaurelia]|uniref:Uncharacterized protein n=1 Tax=Paramecium octaurelia TaxID=43137 RepID=A0A8S1UCL3_PAROT|nr:unnamed protein product [Paramecium octaurelia]
MNTSMRHQAVNLGWNTRQKNLVYFNQWIELEEDYLQPESGKKTNKQHTQPYNFSKRTALQSGYQSVVRRTVCSFQKLLQIYAEDDLYFNSLKYKQKNETELQIYHLYKSNSLFRSKEKMPLMNQQKYQVKQINSKHQLKSNLIQKHKTLINWKLFQIIQENYYKMIYQVLIRFIRSQRNKVLNLLMQKCKIMKFYKMRITFKINNQLSNLIYKCNVLRYIRKSQMKLYISIIKQYYQQIIYRLNYNKYNFINFNQFNQYVQQLENDFGLMIKLTQFDKIQDELNQNKQDKESLLYQIKQNEKTIQLNEQMIINFKKHDEQQIKIIQDLKNQKQELSIKLKEFEQQKISFEVKLQEKEGSLEKCQLSIQKNEEIVQIIKIKFVTQNGKVIENASGAWCCCMCNQMIPKNGVIQFAFKIIEIISIMIGIGFRDIVWSRNYFNCFNIGGGTYNISYPGICYNHDQQDKDDKKIAFPFSTNDIIIVEVDIEKQYEKWTKQSTNESFTLTIITSKDLYPCVHLSGKCKVEILNQVFK